MLSYDVVVVLMLCYLVMASYFWSGAALSTLGVLGLCNVEVARSVGVVGWMATGLDCS